MTSNGFMSREDFLGSASKRRFKDVPLPGGNKARIRSISEGEWAEIDLKSVDKKGGYNIAALRLSDARLIVATVCDHDGNPIFSDADLETIMGFDTGYVLPLVREIKEHCGLRGTVEDAEKNLSATAAASLPSS